VAANRLYGAVPEFLQCNAEEIDISNNRFNGSLPMLTARIVTASQNAFDDAVFPSNITEEVDLASNLLTTLPLAWTAGLLQLIRVDLSHNPLKGWPLAGVRSTRGFTSNTRIIGCVAICEIDPTGCEKPFAEPHFTWPRLTALYVDGCSQIRISARDFLHSVAYLDSLQDLRASGAGLFGDIPMEAGRIAPVPAGCNNAREGFLSLTNMDLSENEITTIEGPRPSSLQMIGLSHNNLTALYDSADGSWYDVRYLDVRDNPQLQLAVDAADSQKKCNRTESSLRWIMAETIANPDGFLAVDERTECTTACPAQDTIFVASPSLHFDSLCRCAPGYAGAGVHCDPCPEDTYSVRPFTNMTAVCMACPRFASTAGRSKLSEAGHCLCTAESGTIKDVSGLCGCADGDFLNYSMPLQDGTGHGACVPCGEGLGCRWTQLAQDDPAGLHTAAQSLLQPIVEAGYVATARERLRALALQKSGDLPGGNDFELWRCKSVETCPGGTAKARLGTCAVGREGLACGACEPQHREKKRFGECEPCPKDGSSVLLTVIAILFGALLVGLLAVHRVASSNTAVSTLDELKPVVGAVKIVLRYLIQLSIVADFSIPWPYINLLLFAWPNFLRFDFVQLVDLNCMVGELGLIGAMAARWAAPVCAVAVLCAAALVNNVLARCSSFWRPANGMQLLELLGTCYGVFLSSIMKLCLLPLECVPHPNGRLTLDEMPAVECRVGEQQALVPIAVAFLLLYVAAYLVFIIYVCYRIRSGAAIATFKFVYADFRGATYWFGPVIVLKDVLCAAVVSLFPGSGSDQILFTALVVTVYLAFTGYYKPFPTKALNHLDVIASSCTVFQIVYGLSFTDKLDEETRASASSWLLLIQVISLAIPAALVTLLLLETFSPRVAAKLPDTRKATEAVTLERLKLLKERGDQSTGWAWLEDVLRSYKIDDVELAELRATMETIAARTDEDLAQAIHVSTCPGPPVGLKQRGGLLLQFTPKRDPLPTPSTTLPTPSETATRPATSNPFSMDGGSEDLEMGEETPLSPGVYKADGSEDSEMGEEIPLSPLGALARTGACSI
jgi:hypothetical protein